MKAEYITLEVERDVRITMTVTEAKLLYAHMAQTCLSNWRKLAEKEYMPAEIGERVNNLYYTLQKLLLL